MGSKALPALVGLAFFFLAACLVAVSLASPIASGDVDNGDGCEFCHDWELVDRLNVSGEMPVLKYRSRRTQMTVVLAQAESPVVNGYFCLTTEAWNDDGLPHTLEHLIFLGSEDYPYKEVLDLMANRCLAKRTNAWTDTDHTCYTVYTAGSSGFINILPVYMDHILFPVLREKDFLTEVHHITADGEDSGVVYSEMQGVENTPSRTIYYGMVKDIYPGNSSYTVRTGGALKNLRESTTMEKIRDYHNHFYRPENMYIIITGQVDPEDIFRALDKVEKKLLKKSYPNFKKPFTATYPEITEDVNKTIKYPSDEEKHGYVVLAWRLPYKLKDNVTRTHALKILGKYLTTTTVSPMMEAFVNVPDPLATDVDFSIYGFGQPAVGVSFDNVPVDKIEEIEPKFREVVAKILADGPDKLNMDRIQTFIKRKVLGHFMNLENGPHLIVPTPAINDMIYGREKGDLQNFLLEGQEEPAKALLDKSPQFWLDLMNETFSAPRIRGLAYPSKEVNKKLVEDEKERIKKQKEKLGEEGLKAAGEAVKSAVEGQKLPPTSVLESIPLADINRISYRTIESFNATTLAQPRGFDLLAIPFRFHLDHVKSKFVRFYMFLNTTDVSQEDRPYLVLLTETWLQSPLRINGELVSLSDVIKRRSEEALSFFNDLGYRGSTFSPGSQSEMIMFHGEVLMDKYLEGVKLLQDSLYNVEFNEERTNSLTTQMLNLIPPAKLKAASIVGVLSDNMYFDRKSVIRHVSFLRQNKFLKKIKEQLDSDPKPVLQKLQEMAKQLVQPDNVAVYMATDVNRLTKAHGVKAAEAWKDFFPKDKHTESDFPTKEVLGENRLFRTEWQFKNKDEPPFRHAIAGIPGSESCYLRQTVDFPLKDWENKEVAALRVALQYITDKMYNDIRGKGLTYGAFMTGSVTEGRLRLSFSRSSQLVEAYKVFRDLLSKYVNPNLESVWDAAHMASAKGSQIYEWAEREETVEDLTEVAVKSILRGTADRKYNRRFVTKIGSVTLDEVRSVTARFLADFLDPSKTLTAVTCGPADVETTKKFFDSIGYKMEIIPDIEDSIMSN